VTALGFGLALLAVATGDPPLLPAVGLAALVGLLVGAPLGAVQGGLASRSSPIRYVVWVAVGALWGEYLAAEIGLFARAGQQTLRLALVTLGAALCGALSFGTLLALVQPLGERAALFGRPRARPILIGASLIVGLAVATYETSAWWLRSYPGRRLGLVSASWLLVCSAILLALELLPRKLRHGAMLGWLALSIPALALSFSAPSEKIARLSGAPQLEHLLRLVRLATDLDRDGFSSLFAGGDCAAFDASVNPSAREVPDNGIDDNCRYGDAKRAPVLRRATAVVHAAPQANLLLVTIDSLRPDHTTPYGYGRDTTPRLAALARESIVFDNAYSPGGWTCIAVPSLFSGVWPRKITTRTFALTKQLTLLDLPWEPKIPANEIFGVMLTLPDQAPRWMLHRAFRARGFQTATAYGMPVAHIVHSLGEGWDAHGYVRSGVAQDSEIVNAALEKLGEFGSSPFFLWVHLFSPHEPQSDHPGARTFGTTLVDRYDHEVAAADRELGRLLDAVDAKRERPTIVVVAGDHGEAFEWGFQFHGNDLFEEGIRIPLIVRAPGVAPRRIAFPASLVDVAPTLLALSGTPSPPGLDGTDLTKLDHERAVLSDLWRLDRNGKAYLDQVVASDSSFHLTLDRLTQETSLTRARDLGRPPQGLKLTLAPARLKDALGAYLEYSEGGP
jgi:hypothetical protein